MIAAEYVYKTCVNNKRVMENEFLLLEVQRPNKINFLRLNMVTVYKRRV